MGWLETRHWLNVRDGLEDSGIGGEKYIQSLIHEYLKPKKRVVK
jgi:hypothetical protein